jgi:ABC-type branched-subunit amino acid transport system substrate-binding protein
MRSIKILYLLSFFFLILIPDALHAQDIQVVDSLFFRGIAVYKGGNYQEALRMMELLDKISPDHPRTTGSLLMQGKSLYKLKKYEWSLQFFQKIVDEYPLSLYVDDALFGIATVHYRLKLYENAVIRLLSVVESSKDRRLQQRAAKLSVEIMNVHMTEKDLHNLLEQVSGEKGKAAVTIRLAQRCIENKHFQKASQDLQDFIDCYPMSPYIKQMKQLLTRARQLSQGVLKCGVILPLTGSFSEQGKGVLGGIQYAVDLHNQGSGAIVELAVRDSESHVLKAIKAAQELCDDQEIVVLIGELESDITAAIAAVAQEREIVLLAPTATTDGLTSIGSFIFQLNSGISARGRMLAEYAFNDLGIQRYAILAPADEYGKAMRDSFVEKIEGLGGEIVVEKWYFEGAEELGSYLGTQFRGIREEGLKRMVQDSLVIIISEEEWEELEEGLVEERNGIYVKQEFAELVDSTALAVTSIEGIFLPVYYEDLKYVAPNFAYNNIRATILGGISWNDIEFLEEHRNYVNGVYFLSDFYPDPADYRYFRLRDNYRKDVGKTPGKMEVFGYDTANLLLQIVGEKSLSRKKICDRFAEMRKFKGIRGIISFNEQRVNRFIHMLQYLDGNVLWIK